MQIKLKELFNIAPIKMNMKKVFFVIFMLVLYLPSHSQIMWNLKGGIMPRSYVVSTSYDTYTENRIEWMAGLEMEIPLNDKLNIETGLRYRNHYSLDLGYDEDDYYSFRNMSQTATSHLELPIRLAYKKPLGKHFMFHAGIGPYASYTLGMGEGKKNSLQVGLEPSVAINWSCLSLSLRRA